MRLTEHAHRTRLSKDAGPLAGEVPSCSAGDGNDVKVTGSVAPNHEVVDAAIRQRRTCLRLDPDRPVPAPVLHELCTLATWAPNHHRTEPWRFAVFQGAGRLHLGELVAAALERTGAPPAKVDKARRKYIRAPHVLVVASVPGPDDRATAENRDAVAAAVATLLLGAQARGLATYWGSLPDPGDVELASVCGFPEGSIAVAAVYVGYPTGTCPPPPRHMPMVKVIDG